MASELSTNVLIEIRDGMRGVRGDHETRISDVEKPRSQASAMIDAHAPP